MRSPAQVSPAGLGGAAANLPGSAGSVSASGASPANGAAIPGGAGAGAFVASENALLAVGIGNSEDPPVLAAVLVAAAVDAILQGFLDLFGGGGSAPKPYQERGGRHPIFDFLGITFGWTLSKASAAPASPSNVPALQRVEYSCHCGCAACPTQQMDVTGYSNGYESTGKNPGDPGYGFTSNNDLAGMGTLAAPRPYGYGTRMFIPGYGCGTVQDRGGDIQGNELDLWFPNALAARLWGRQSLGVEVCQ